MNRHDADAALASLVEGNRRFAEGVRRDAALDSSRRRAVATGQSPKAIVLGCSDSRVPAEYVFDQGLGDLFVIRVAGNIVAPSLIGSVEFAAERFGTRLVVVLGHARCGAIETTVEHLRARTAVSSPGLASIVARIAPVVGPLIEREPEASAATLVARAVRLNIQASATQLLAGSALLARLAAEDGLRIIGAEYALDSGQVTWLDDPAT